MLRQLLLAPNAGDSLKLSFLALSLLFVVGCGPAGPRVSPQESAHLTEEFVVACAMTKPYIGGATRDTVVETCRCLHREASKDYGVRELHAGMLGGEGPKIADLAAQIATCRAEIPAVPAAENPSHP
jgi:hypothetical protein